VTVSGIDALCPNFNCGYTYISEDALINEQYLGSYTRVVVTETSAEESTEESDLLTRADYTDFPAAQVKALDLDVFYY
jgi:hypothetical protein